MHHGYKNLGKFSNEEIELLLSNEEIEPLLLMPAPTEPDEVEQETNANTYNQTHITDYTSNHSTHFTSSWERLQLENHSVGDGVRNEKKMKGAEGAGVDTDEDTDSDSSDVDDEMLHDESIKTRFRYQFTGEELEKADKSSRIPYLLAPKDWKPRKIDNETKQLQMGLELIAAIENAKWDKVNDLVAKDIDLWVQDAKGYNALHKAIIAKNSLLTRWLLRRLRPNRGSSSDLDIDDINEVTEEGLSPLHWACINDDLRLVIMLLFSGANAHKIMKDEGYNCFHIVAATGNVRIAKRLLKYGVDFTHKSKAKETPKEIAKMMEREEMMEFFKEAEKKEKKQNKKILEKERERARKEWKALHPNTHNAYGTTYYGCGGYDRAPSPEVEMKRVEVEVSPPASPSWSGVNFKDEAFQKRVKLRYNQNSSEDSNGEKYSKMVNISLFDSGNEATSLLFDSGNEADYEGNDYEGNNYFGNRVSDSEDDTMFCYVCSCTTTDENSEYCSNCGLSLTGICNLCGSTNNRTNLQTFCWSCNSSLFEDDQDLR